MSIRQVKCPKCNTVANVSAGTTNVRCSKCSAVWNVNNPASVQSPSAAPRKRTGQGKSFLPMIIGSVCVVVVVAIIGVSAIWLTTPVTEPKTEPVQANSANAEVAPPASDVEATFREVDLPESTRRAIYRDYRDLVTSSTEKKVMIPKDSPVNKSLQNMLGKTVDREITHFALIHNISEEDVLQIVAEGDAKQWPGSRKPETAE